MSLLGQYGLENQSHRAGSCRTILVVKTNRCLFGTNFVKEKKTELRFATIIDLKTRHSLSRTAPDHTGFETIMQMSGAKF